MIEVIIASLGYAGGIVANKFIFCKYRVPVYRFIPLLFVWLALITAVFLRRWGTVDLGLIQDVRIIFIFVLMIAVAISWNLLYYKGIQKEDLHEFELIMLFSPLATIVLASIMLPSERSWSLFLPGIIASGALLVTRVRKHHLKIGMDAWKTIIAMVLLSFESILIKELLGPFSPVALYFVRTLILAIIFFVVLRPKIFQMHRSAYALTILSAIFGVMQMVLKYYGFQSLGVVETTMILVLGPFLVYIASALFFKEKLFKRDVFAATTVVLCILYVQFWR